jgi:translation elongation factor EF-Tu-like GTPase
MVAWFRRKSDDDSIDAQVLLAKAHAAQPVSPSGPFRMPVDDVFSIQGRGTVVTGKVEAGSINNGDTVRLNRVDGTSREVVVDGVEMFRKVVDTATAGDNVGLLFRSLGRNDVGRGDVLSS